MRKEAYTATNLFFFRKLSTPFWKKMQENGEEAKKI